MNLEIELPWPPSVNHYYRHVGSMVKISAEGRKYREKVISTLAKLGIKKFTEKLHIHIEVFPPDKRRRDLDNLLKPMLDALEHGDLYDNDFQIDHLTIVRMNAVKNGRVLLCIRKNVK